MDKELKSLGTRLLHLVVVVLGLVAGREAQGQSVRTVAPGSSPSRLEVSAGYSFFSPFSSDINLHNYESIHAGAVLDATFYINRMYGIQGEASLFPKGPKDNNCVNTAMIGPVVRARRGHFSPFGHLLAGAAQAGGPQNQLCSVWGWGLTTGFGVDYKTSFLPQRITIRPIQLDYTYSHVDNGPLNIAAASGGLGKVYAFRYTAGLTIRLDGSHFIRPTLVCSASPEVGFAGDPMIVTGNVLNAQSLDEDHFLWTATAGHVTEEGGSARLDTTGLHPGMYHVTGRYYQGKNARHSSFCTTQFQIREASPPPSIACYADPATPTQGDPVSIRATGDSAAGRPLTYTYSTTGGTLTKSGDGATLNTAGQASGRYQITCSATDDLGRTVSAGTAIDLLARPVVADALPLPRRSNAAAAPVAAAPVSEAPPASVAVVTAPAAPAGKTMASSRVAPRPRSVPVPKSSSVPAARPSSAPAAKANAAPAPQPKAVPARGPSAPPVVTASPVPVPSRLPQVQRMCTLTFAADPGKTTALPAEAKPCLDRAADMLRRDKTSTLSLSGGYAADEVNGRAVERILSAADYLTLNSHVALGRLHMRLAPRRTRTLIVAVIPDNTQNETLQGAGLGGEVDLSSIIWRAPDRKH